MSANEIPKEHKCCKCKRDLRIKKEDGGCECPAGHGSSGRQVPKCFVDYDAYDGYGYYDYARYLMDR